jgi:hypothetical protein
LAVAFALFLLGAGCGVSGPAARTPDAAAMFAPVAMRIHPIFSEIKDWTGDDKPDGVEVNLEFEDQFGDPTKAAGTVVFELFAYRQYEPDPRGERVVNPWIGPLRTLADQQARWNRTSRTYAFQLEYPPIRVDRSYVLTATFNAGGTRFFDRIVLEATQPKSKRGTAESHVKPTTRPLSTQPEPANAPRPSSS